jgi:heme oxygenase (mycobilin-producing)
MSEVVLINPIEIPVGEEDAFLSVWLQAAEHMRHAPGFRSLQLHKSLDPQAKFRFVNVAKWESQEQWQKAVNTQPAWIVEEMRNRWPTAYPALYQIIIE